MMYEEELVERDEVSTRSFPGRSIPEFSNDSNIDKYYNFTHLEVFATCVIMLSTISGGFLEGYSSPVVSSLLDNQILTSVGNHSKISDNSTVLNITTGSSMGDMINESHLLTNKSHSSTHDISIHFSIEQASWFGSLLLLGAFIGAVMSSMFLKIGRRHGILLSSLPRFFGWLFIIFSPSVSAIYFGRFLTGFSIGMVTSAGPIYISEVTHSSKRGGFSCFIQLGVNLGIFLAALIGASIAWKALAVIGAVSVLVYAIPTLIIPNSPYWLVLQDRDDDAKNVLKQMRPNGYEIEDEFIQIKAVAQNMKRNKSISWRELFQERRCFVPLLVVLIVTAVNRFSGYNAVISYCSTFLHHAVPTISPTWTAVTVCFMQVLATLASIALVDVWGRRKLLLSSISIMAISLIIIALNDILFKNGIPLIAVISTIVYVSSYSMGLGPLTLVLLGEMLPLDARDKGSAIVASLNWLAAFLVTKTFFSLENVLGISGVCLTYSLVCIIGLVLIYFIVPETKGRTLSEIEAHFSYSRGKFFQPPRMDRTISNIVDQEFSTIDSYSTFT